MNQDMDSTGYTLIAGATSALGREFAELFSADGINLVLVGEDEQVLKEMQNGLKERFDTDVVVHQSDLAKKSAGARVYNAMQAAGVRVDCLVYCANLQYEGPFHDTEWLSERAMLHLHIETPTELIKLYGIEMLRRDRGRILLLCPLPTFPARPGRTVYDSTRAYAFRFVRSLACAWRSRGVTITGLCVSDKPQLFGSVPDESGIASNGAAFKSPPGKMARKGYRAMVQGRPFATARLQDWFRMRIYRFVM